MGYLYRLVLLSLTALLSSSVSFSQTDAAKPVKVAVFIPIYTNDAFNGPVYILGKGNLPKGMLPGLEFYNGVMLAVDSLNREGTFAEISVYDTKSTEQTLADILKSPAVSSTGLIIAAITNTTELKAFSDFGVQKNIPVISATYPNYVGVTGNPFFVLLNSSFQAHLDGLYKYMKRFHAANEILAVTRRSGKYEEYIKTRITNLNKSATSAPLKIKWVAVDEATVTSKDFMPMLDSTKNNIVFVGSPLESFGLSVVKSLSNMEGYRTTAIGMPTWDNLKELDKPECKNVDIVFSTPFLYYSQNKQVSSAINSRYKEKYSSRPSDMVFKGFETTYHFTKLLVKHRHNLINNLSDKDFTVFNEFKLEPLKVSKTSVKPDLLENKKLYFIKKQQGNLKGII